jgi:hypothetical protein
MFIEFTLLTLWNVPVFAERNPKRIENYWHLKKGILHDTRAGRPDTRG